MRSLQFVFAAFIPFFSFFFLFSAGGTVQSNVYVPKFWLLVTFIVVCGFWSVGIASKGKSLLAYLHQYRTSRQTYWILAYIIWLLVASFLSPMPGYAWLGSPDVQVGSLFLIFCYCIAGIYHSSTRIDWIIKALAMTTLTMVVLAVLEALGFRPLSHWFYSERMVFPAATIGLRQHLGGWFAIMTLAPVFFYRERTKNFWFWLWLVSSLLGISLSTNSAATAGVSVGLLLWLGINLKRANWKLPLTVLTIFLISVIFVPPLTTFASHNLGMEAPTFKNYGSAYTLKARIILWKSAFRASLQRPLVGWGDETFAYQVFEHLDTEDAKNLFRAELGLSDNAKVSYGGFTYYVDDSAKNIHSTGSLLYHRAHSIIFDELYSHGFPGLILLTALIVALLRHVYRRERSAFPFFVVAVLPYPVYLLAWFYVPTVTPLFFIMIGTMLADLQRPLSTPQEASHAANPGLYAD